MTQQSYKILAAKRLAIDPNALLMYTELNASAIVTTPDGIQHIFTFAELNHPAPSKNLAEKAQKGPGSPLASPQLVDPAAISVAPVITTKPKTVTKHKGKK